jgi:hypothetical protein
MVAPALMPLCVVVLTLMSIWVTLLDTITVFATMALASRSLGMGVVAIPLMNKVFASAATWVTTTSPLGMGLVVPFLLLLGGAVQALTPILVAVSALIVGPTTRPLGIGVVALALLLLGAAILALRPISVAVLASMAMQTIHGFSTQPIRVVVVILMFLGAILALVGLVNSPYWMLPVSHWMPARFIPHVVGPVSHWMLARISPLAVGPVSNWILAMILLLFFDQMTLTTISAPLPIASGLVSHWMPARISSLAVGPVSHWILVMILLLFFGRMPLTRFSPLTTASGLYPTGRRTGSLHSRRAPFRTGCWRQSYYISLAVCH